MNREEKIKGAIIGFGFISSMGHLPAYLKRQEIYGDVEIVAICDTCLSRELHVPSGIKFYDKIEDLLASELDNLDFLDISTHAADHFKIAKLGLENGLHVLCEKPLTTSVHDADELIKIALKNKKVLFPCHNYKFSPVVKAVRNIIESGTIGSVHAVTLSTYRNTHALGTSDWIPDWRRLPELSGGGIAMDHGSHSLYLMFEWLRGYPFSVTAHSQNKSYPKFNTEDNFSAVYEFEAGVANVNLSWTSGVRKVIYTLQGKHGAITVDDDQIEVATINNEDNECSSYKANWTIRKYSVTSDWMDSSHVNWFNSMFDKFRLAIDKDDFVNNEVIDAYHCVSAIMKAYESIENKSIKLPLENKFSWC